MKKITKELGEGHPNVVDVIKDGSVNGAVNTITKGRIPLRDGFYICQAAADNLIPCFTSLDISYAVLQVLADETGTYSAKPLPEYRNKEPV
ncbi:hypothetical protein ACFLT8_04455 [Chloroflexota bacterium]